MLRTLFISLLIIFPLATQAAEQTAIFGGGCFWCVQSDFDKVPGVTKTVVGFDGGVIPNPDYHKVSTGNTQYVEVTKITYDPKVVSYTNLLQYFFRHIDPTDKDGQFCDKGKQYRSVIFYLNAAQKKSAERVLTKVKKLFPKTQIYTEVLPSTTFYPADAYHQKYYKRNPIRYRFYRATCGRDARVKAVWRSKNKAF